MPERFLDANGQIDRSRTDPEDATFGFGRRFSSPPRSMTDPELIRNFKGLPWPSLRGSHNVHTLHVGVARLRDLTSGR